MRPQTFADLARKHGVELPTRGRDKLYDYDSIYEFLEDLRAWSPRRCRIRRTSRRTAYESIEDGVELGNLKYREMFFNPTLHTRRGVPYKTVVDGLVDGIHAGGAEARRQVPSDRRRLPPGPARDGARDGRAGARAPAATR